MSDIRYSLLGKCQLCKKPATVSSKGQGRPAVRLCAMHDKKYENWTLTDRQKKILGFPEDEWHL